MAAPALEVAMLATWVIMYVLLSVACAIICRDARAKGEEAALWVIAAIVPGTAGLLLMLLPSLVQAQLAWVCAPFGVLLTVLGPLVYLLSWERGGHAREEAVRH